MMRFSDFRRSRKCNFGITVESPVMVIAWHNIQRDNFLIELKKQNKEEDDEENENQMKNNKMYCKNGNRR